MSTPLLNYIKIHKQDAAIYKAKTLYASAGDDIHMQTEAIGGIKLMLACIDDEILADFYIKRISSEIGTAQKALAKAVKTVQDTERRKNDEVYLEEGYKPFPKWVNQNRIFTIGFDWQNDTVAPSNTGMYFHAGRGVIQRLTNFTVEPIVQIISDDENSRRRITKISNGHGYHVFELPSAAFTSTTKFETILMDQGYYHTEEGFTQSQLNRIKSYFLGQYPRGYEITNLGYQDEGFFAFSNVIYHDGIKHYDDYGLADVDGIKYLSMGASNILQNLRKGTDGYKNDKFLHYTPASIGFKEWTRLMLDVYEEKAMMGVAWCLLAVNRDIVFSRTNYCPIPYCYGAAQSGKSQFVGSLTSIFTMGQKPLNLNQATVFAFWEYTGRFRNVLMAYNEFDAQALPEAITKAFKGFADGEGRLRGTGKRNKSETMEVNCLPVLLGQYLATVDDGAVLSRSLAEKFVENNNRSKEQVEKFQQLKDHERKGLTGLLVSIIQHRSAVSADYATVYNEVTAELKADFEKSDHTPKNRVLENYTAVLALMKIYQDCIDFAFSYDDFYAYCKKQIMNLNTLIGESNSLGEFWKMLERLSDSGEIEPGWDYKIETRTELKSMIANKSSANVIQFDKATRFLFLRFNSAYPIIAKEKRNISGKAAIGDDTIKGYLIDQAYYVGASSNSNFTSKKLGIKKGTSSMVLNYDMLVADGVNLLEDIEEDDRTQVTIDGLIMENAIIQNLFGTEKVVFTLLKDESHFRDQIRVEKKTYTKCFWTDLSQAPNLKLGDEIKVTGLLSVAIKKDRQFRNLEIQSIEVIKQVPRDAPPQPAATQDPPPTPVNNQLSFDQIDAGDGATEDRF
jgi:DNA primase